MFLCRWSFIGLSWRRCDNTSRKCSFTRREREYFGSSKHIICPSVSPPVSIRVTLVTKTRKASPDPFVAGIVTRGRWHLWLLLVLSRWLPPLAGRKQNPNRISSFSHVLSFLLRGGNLLVVVKIFGFKDVWFIQDPSLRLCCLCPWFNSLGKSMQHPPGLRFSSNLHFLTQMQWDWFSEENVGLCWKH